MISIGELIRRIRHLARRDQAARDLEDEMRLHLEMRAAQVGDAQARRKFGNRTSLQQQSRDAWGFGRIEDVMSDVRFASRRILKQRTVSLTVIVVMGIGIGATTAMFSAVDAALLRPLPFEQPEQLVMLSQRVPFGNRPERTDEVSYNAVTRMSELFSHVAAYGVGGLNLSDGRNSARVKVGVVTADFFATLGVHPSSGRTFNASEGVPNGPRVAVLSEALWKRQFGGRAISDMKITLNNKTYDVVGVMPSAFTFPEMSELWIPMSVPHTAETFEAFRDFVRQTVIARVADGMTVQTASDILLSRMQQARASRTSKDAAADAEWLARMRKDGGPAVPLQKLLAVDRSVALYVLLGATGMLLLIACANVTNLLLAQASVRRREIAVRQVLGATRTRIVRQLLTESILLSLSGAVVGVFIAFAAFQALQAFMPPRLLGLAEVHVDWRVLAFSIALACIAGVVFGLWPAIGGSRDNASDAIKSGDGHGATGSRSGQLRRVLVGTELAFTVVLLIAAGIMLRSFERIVNRDAGVQTANVGTMELAFPMSSKIPERLRMINLFTGKIAELPGVIVSGASKTLPLATAGQLLVSIEVPGANEEKSNARETVGAIYEDATSGYFKALNIPLIEGRYFNENEDRNPSTSAILNATAARRHWPGKSAVGQRFHMGGDTTMLTVVGVVADVPRKLDDEMLQQVYHPLAGNAPFVATIVARGASSSSAILRQMEVAVRSIDPGQPVFNLRMMNDVRDVSIAPRRTSTKFLTIFALLALTLASVGVYAVVSYGLAQRQRELGIRSALGATGGNLLVLLSREMVWVAIVGVSIGMTAAWAGARVLENLAYDIDVHDRATFTLVPVALVVATMLATLVPARRAFRVNPADVMRAD